MKAYVGYEKGKATMETERLPMGGYIVRILNAEEVVFEWGRQLKFSIDIAEGSQKDFYKKNYDGQNEPKKWKGVYTLSIPEGNASDEKDSRRKGFFESQIACIEESNKGYEWDWDEVKLKDKLVGAVFGNQQYEFNGKKGFYTKCFGFRTMEAIRENKFKEPQDRLLKQNNAAPNQGFYPVNDSVSDEDIPF